MTNMKNLPDSTKKVRSTNPSNRRDFIKHMPYLACYPVDPFKKLPDQLAYLLHNTIEPFFQISWNIKLLTGQVLNGRNTREENSMHGSIVRIIGIARAKTKIGMMNLTYNICRCTQLKIVVAPVVSKAELMG